MITYVIDVFKTVQTVEGKNSLPLAGDVLEDILIRTYNHTRINPMIESYKKYIASSIGLYVTLADVEGVHQALANASHVPDVMLDAAINDWRTIFNQLKHVLSAEKPIFALQGYREGPGQEHRGAAYNPGHLMKVAFDEAKMTQKNTNTPYSILSRLL
jgi:hypothetical protein